MKVGIELRRRTLLGMLVAGGASAARQAKGQSRFQNAQLTVQGLGSSGPVVQQLVFDELDRDEGCRSVLVQMDSAAALARMRAEAAAPQIDIFQFTGGQELIVAREGLAASLSSISNWGAIPDRLKAPDGRWIAYGREAQGLIYRTDKLKSPPRSYKDLLNPDYNGHVAIPSVTNGFGSDLLVMMARSYGGDERDISPGLKALAQAAQGNSVFRATSDLMTLMVQSDIWLAAYDINVAVRCQALGLPVSFAVPEEGCPAVSNTICIAAKTPNLDLALEAVDRLLSAPVQVALSEKMSWAPANSTVALPGQIAPLMPPPNKLVAIDEAFVQAHRSQWVEQWERDLSR